MSESFAIYSPQEYFDELIHKVDGTKKGDRVAIKTMALDVEDSNVEALFESMGAAAERKVKTHLIFDAYARIFDMNSRPSGMLHDSLKTPKITAHFADKTRALSALEDQGVIVAQTNTPPAIHVPIAGRSHIKGAVVNNEWLIGGINLADTDNLDAMIGGNKKATADFLYSVFQKIAEVGDIRGALGDTDIVWPIDESTDLLIDVGIRGQSLIYDRALKAIDNAEDWVTFTCQFFPLGTTTRKLAQTIRRGVDSYVFFNKGDRDRLGGTGMRSMALLSKLALPRELFRGQLADDAPYLHAKILATEKEAIIGSHNMVDIGVRLGTAEIALHTKDPRTIRQIALMAHRLASSDDDPEFLSVNH